jgi:hypothetical protein
VPGVVEVLIQEPTAEAMPGVGQQRVDRAAVRGGVEPLDAAATSRSNPSRAQIAASS